MGVPFGTAVHAVFAAEICVWWHWVLKSSRLVLFWSIEKLVLVTLPAPTPHAQRMKSPALSVAFVMYSASTSCSLSKVLAAALTTAIRWKGLLEFAAMTALTSKGAARKEADPG